MARDASYTTLIRRSRCTITARYDGTCRHCKTAYSKGDTVYWFPKSKKIEHVRCVEQRSR